MFDLTGKTALVTGATGGIGGAIARGLHAAGATVLCAGTRIQVLDQLVSELGERALAAAGIDLSRIRVPATRWSSAPTPIWASSTSW